MRVTQIIADLHVTDLKAAKSFYTRLPRADRGGIQPGVGGALHLP